MARRIGVLKAFARGNSKVMGAVDADGSGNIGWTEVLAAILLTQESCGDSAAESLQPALQEETLTSKQAAQRVK